MSDGNKIDELFKSKLGGREVAYSASACAGANELLNQHYKWLFLRKLLWFLLPIAVISGIGVGYFSEDKIDQNLQPKMNAGLSVISEADSTDECNETWSIDLGAETKKNTEQTIAISNPVMEEHVNSEKLATTFNTDIKAHDRVELRREQPEPFIKSVPTSIENSPTKAVSTSVSKAGVAEKRRGFFKDLNIDDRKMISNDLASIILNENLDLLPISQLPFHGIQDSTNALELNISEPLMEELRKVQLFIGGGLLFARGQHDLNVERLGPGVGLHASFLVKYNLAESVFLDFRIGGYNRSSLTPTLSFAGSQMNSKINVKPLLINYGSIYIGTGYQIGARHSFGGGLEFNPMLTVLARKEKSIVGESTTEVNYLTDKTGFNGLDAAAILNYRLSVTERVDATAEMHFGLFDATDNAVFKTGDVSDHNTLMKLGVSYRLTNR